MPYKLVIADDEKKIREGLAQYIDWESLGFDVVAELEDGRDLISYLEENDVDVILTDIRMNEVSGLQVAEYVHTKKRDIKVVIISGFADFDYARQAIEYGVKKYLIKPTDMDEVNAVFAELKQELDANYAQKEAVVSEKVFLDEIKPLLSKQFFVNVMMGAFRDKSELLAKAKFLRQNIDLTDSVCGVYKC